MSKTSRWILSIPVAISLPLVSPAPAFSAETKNELGMYTVKCQVVKNGPGNPKVGLIYGNHPKSAKKLRKMRIYTRINSEKMRIKGTVKLRLDIRILELSL